MRAGQTYCTGVGAVAQSIVEEDIELGFGLGNFVAPTVDVPAVANLD